jgi:ABC-type nickel/cobalt efflux system permease component RcnA
MHGSPSRIVWKRWAMSEFNELICRAVIVLVLIIGFWACWRACVMCEERRSDHE